MHRTSAGRPKAPHSDNNAQWKFQAKTRPRGADCVPALGGLGISVTTQTDAALFSTIERTMPVTAEPFDLTVAVRPLNCAMRKRRTSFWSAVSNVNIRALLCSRHYRSLSLFVCENP